MKRFYVHYEGEPEFTFIAKWTDKTGSFADLIQVSGLVGTVFDHSAICCSLQRETPKLYLMDRSCQVSQYKQVCPTSLQWLTNKKEDFRE